MDHFYALLYEAGLTYRQILHTPFYHLTRAIIGLNKQHERADRRTLATLNHIRAVVGADPIDVENPKGARRSESKEVFERLSKIKAQMEED